MRSTPVGDKRRTSSGNSNEAVRILWLAAMYLVSCSASFSQYLNSQQQIGAYASGDSVPSRASQIRFELNCDTFQHPIRQVRGKIYDLRPLAKWIAMDNRKVKNPSPEWKFTRAKVLSVPKDGLLVYLGSAWNETVYFVTNYPGNLADDQPIHFWAVDVRQNYKYRAASGETKTVRTLDCGTPYIPPLPTKEQIESAKAAAAQAASQRKAATQAAEQRALEWNQKQAAKGDAFGEFRMGERYRDGDGVEQDLSKAREFFQKSAEQGNAAAVQALKDLNRP